MAAFHWRDPLIAASLLTRIPVPLDHGAAGARMAAAAWAWPVVGAGIGAASGAALAVAHGLGVAPLAAAALAIALALLATGALHEDGLGDVADGFGGGATVEQRLEIMRDSRIGAFGAAAVTLALIAKAGLLATLADAAPLQPVAVCAAAGAFSRCGLPAMMRAGPWARPGGLASWVGRPAMPAVVGAAVAGGVALACVTPWTGLAPALAAALLCAGVCAGLLTLARRRIGGVTGDVLGAAQVLAELAALAALTAV